MAKAPAERGPLGISLSSYLCPDTDGDTLKAAKVWTLTEVLVREKQHCLEARGDGHSTSLTNLGSEFSIRSM